jgi:hypothetical protein
MHTRQAAAPLPSVGGVLSVSPLEGGVANPRAVSDAALIEGRVDESVLHISTGQSAPVPPPISLSSGVGATW